MIRANAYYLYELGSTLHPLTGIDQDTPAHTIYFHCIMAHGAIAKFIINSIYQPGICIQSGDELLGVLQDAREHLENKGLEGPLDTSVIYAIKSCASKFESILGAELSVSPLYLIIQKSAYDTERLVASGELLFPIVLRDKVPEAISDIQQATKCLAFEALSACGFHLHRATESVLRKYFSSVTNGANPPRGRAIGDYLSALDKIGCGDDKIKASLRDLKDLHRNPLIHPEHSIGSVDEAIALLGNVQAVITHMLTAIPIQQDTSEKPQTGSSASTVMRVV